MQIIYHRRMPDEIHRQLSVTTPPYIPFRDASYGTCSYSLTLQHCFTAVQKAVTMAFLDFNHFNHYEYEHYEKVENGDFNWIIPGELDYCLLYLFFSLVFWLVQSSNRCT